MSSARKTFIELSLKGKVLLEEIDDFVDEWHEHPSGRKLHEHLDMTEGEFSLWLRVPETLPYIIKARRDHRSFKN